MYGVSHEGKYCTFNKNISDKKNQTTVRGQDGKISDTRGKDFYWSPTRRSLVGDQKSFPWVSEIFPSCPITGVRSFISRQSVTRDDIADINAHLVLIAITHCMSWLP